MDYDFRKKLELFFSVLSQSKYGSILVYYKNKEIFKHSGNLAGPRAEISIKNKKCLDDFFIKGDLGWAESYIEENWDTKNLTDFLEWGAKNFHEFSKFIRGKWYIILHLRLKHFFNRNTKNGSQKNISFHYDLGNNFYKTWLDKSMTYSSAIFKESKDDLYKAQINKYKNLSKLIDVKSSDKILEIGCGWGGFSEFLAKSYKAKITAITISERQYESVKENIFKKKLNEYINVQLTDYRDVRGKFDKIVSIEMFEAVGEKYWKDYFKILRDNLKNNGSIGLQTITIDERFFNKYRKFPDFIQTYIFPGGMLPSIQEMNKVLGSTGLKVDSQFMFGDHYAKTLEYWRGSFDRSWDNIKNMGFNNTFKRMWNYYLSYCQGGFQSGNINVGQFLIKKI
jgi:cyclopropane-fatty-acyl-phospholipid synthase